jgi:hypothetical protein
MSSGPDEADEGSLFEPKHSQGLVVQSQKPARWLEAGDNLRQEVRETTDSSVGVRRRTAESTLTVSWGPVI